MPYNILIFIVRKPGISHTEFKKQYETSHMPLLQFYGGQHFPNAHKRHYLQFNDGNDAPTVVQGDKGFFDFDVIAESSYDDEAAFHAFVAMLKKEEASKVLRADEDKFSDREKMKIVVVGDVQETET
jgi:hypothetical protein